MSVSYGARAPWAAHGDSAVPNAIATAARTELNEKRRIGGVMGQAAGTRKAKRATARASSRRLKGSQCDDVGDPCGGRVVCDVLGRHPARLGNLIARDRLARAPAAGKGENDEV